MAEGGHGGRERGRARRAGARRSPLVVFVDNGFAGFEQMACSLRRRGVHVAGVEYGPRFRMTTARLMATYGRLRAADSAAQLAERLRGFAGFDIVDVVCSEALLPDVVDAAEQAQCAPDLVSRLRWRLDWSDKAVASLRLREAGVPVPATVVLDAEAVSTTALPSVRFPVVVKAGLGAGGDGVRIVRDGSGLRQAVKDMARLQGSLFLEEFVAGRNLCYCASYGPDGVYQEGVYESLRLDESSTAPSRAVLTLDHPGALEVGRRVVEVIGGSGLANIEMMEANDGALSVIDLNLRPWGCIELLKGAGVEFDRGYLRSLRLAGPAPYELMGGGYRADVYPVATWDRMEEGPQAVLRHFRTSLAPMRREVGGRYALAVSAALTVDLLRRQMGGRRSARRPRRLTPPRGGAAGSAVGSLRQA